MSTYFTKIWVVFIAIELFQWTTELSWKFDVAGLLMFVVQVILAMIAGATHEAKVCAGNFDEVKDAEGTLKDEYKDYIDGRGYMLMGLSIGLFVGVLI